MVKYLHLTFFLAILSVFTGIGCSEAFAKCADRNSPLGALIKSGQDDGKRMPLILIHGIHGTADNVDVAMPTAYWNQFRTSFRRSDSELAAHYSLYIFQYCSDRESVAAIALKLRDLIDEQLPDRNHVILAHSMGGLVAKSYLVETTHLKGKWRGKTGGDTIFGLVTLATPHHGTPGANAPSALRQYFPLAEWETYLGRGFSSEIKFAILNFIYWNEDELRTLWSKAKQECADGVRSTFTSKRQCILQILLSDEARAVSSSSLEYNRRDLRWDNYDSKITSDTNDWLSGLNSRFKTYADRIILYAGILKPTPLDASSMIGVDSLLDDHAKLTFADGMLYFGLNRSFGYTDGLVPYKSAMLCDHDPSSTAELSCSSRYRIRRFEFGNPRATVPPPNQKTLSIIRTPGGFDHKEMYENGFVIQKVTEDLLGFMSKAEPPTGTPPPAAPVTPTLFLFDVSGSMTENDKIGQARTAGLDALKEMRESGSAPTSIMTFSGDQCGSNVTKKLLGYTSDLIAVERTMRTGLPAPNGGTPLPQARDEAFSDLSIYLNINPSLKEGRIILLSDGQSTCGAIRPPGVFSRRDIGVRRSAGSKIKYFTIGFDVPAGSVAERDLQFLASETGGKYYNAVDRQQLISAFRKQVRQYIPRPCNTSNPDFAAGLRAFANLDHFAAVEAFRRYSSANQTDWCGYYNLALAYEASDRYKKAADHYQRYLAVAPNSPDRIKVEEKIAEMKLEYAVQFDYFTRLINSDLDYLNSYYRSIFNRTSQELAAEFSGFVYEKQDFYAALPDILEVDSNWLANDAKDISSAIDTLSKRTRLNTFDRDAVSLLTIPIAQIEDLLERLRKNRSLIIR